MAHKRLRSLLFPLFTLLGICWSSILYAQDTVSIVLGATNKESGIKLLNTDETTVVKKGGREGREGSIFYFDVDKTFAFEGSVKTLFVTVKYFDEGTDRVELHYDAHNPENPDPSLDDPDKDINRDPETATRPLVRFDTKTWVQHTFTLSDVWFGNRQEKGADFSVVGGEGSTITISEVIVTKKTPIELQIPYADQPPKIDGILDEPLWALEAGSFKVCSAAQDIIQPTKWRNEEDYCAVWHFAWDKDNLYFAADVTDDLPRCNTRDYPNFWNGDGWEIYLGWDQSNPGRTSYIPGMDYQLIASAGDPPKWGILATGAGVVNLEEEGKAAANYVVIKDKTTPKKGYFVEGKLPWSFFPDPNGNPHTAPAPNQLFGFNILANDGDGTGHEPTGEGCGQEIAMSFTGRPAAFRNPSAWATVLMLPPAPKISKGDLNGDGKVAVSDAVLALRIVVGTLTPSSAQSAAADVNGDGRVTIQDVLFILQAAVGKRTL